LRSRVCALLVMVVVVGGCGSSDDWSEPHAKPTAIGTFGPGFFDPTAPPAPESTITPRPGSWDGVHPSKGYRVVMLTAGEDRPTKTLVDAVSKWADEEDVSLKTVIANAGNPIPGITSAMALKPDLIISAGNPLVDPMALVTANHLGQQFLVIGAELAEPTHNVTAANWAGASFRGEGLGTSTGYNPASFTAERADRAIRAGVAAVLNNLTGIVIQLD
jgi:hypothetical protein